MHINLVSDFKHKRFALFQTPCHENQIHFTDHCILLNSLLDSKSLTDYKAFDNAFEAFYINFHGGCVPKAGFSHYVNTSSIYPCGENTPIERDCLWVFLISLKTKDICWNSPFSLTYWSRDSYPTTGFPFSLTPVIISTRWHITKHYQGVLQPEACYYCVLSLAVIILMG